MATSSITANFSYTDRKSASRFLNALERVASSGVRRRGRVPCQELRTPDEVRSFFAGTKAR